MDLIVGDQTYRVEFRYVTKLGKRPELRSGAVKAVTTAVLIAGAPRYRTPLVAIDNALCSDTDNFSRNEGRMRSFKKLLDRCGAIQPREKAELWLAFHVRNLTPMFSGPIIDLDLSLPMPKAFKNPRSKPTPELIDGFKEAGKAKRLFRAVTRAQAAAMPPVTQSGARP